MINQIAFSKKLGEFYKNPTENLLSIQEDIK